jgi:hypothetical protein
LPPLADSRPENRERLAAAFSERFSTWLALIDRRSFATSTLKASGSRREHRERGVFA